LLQVAALLRSARIAYKNVNAVTDELPRVKQLVMNLAFDKNLEEDITSKIIGENEVSDYASSRLYSLRQEIRKLNERIRAKLGEYLSGETAKYLQDSIITMRDDRYVLPVRTEYKRSVKGFIHDKSQSGATVFIEPEYVLELNNELKSLMIDEKEEVEEILHGLSVRVGGMSSGLIADMGTLSELDGFFARAEYGYKQKAVCPLVNDKGIVKIARGRHPLIEAEKVIPVSVSLGESYNFLLISGPNTGGKTVTLKMVGLFCLMAACGLFIPAAADSEVAIFRSVYCDLGDAQSIEESLSTFSSHITNLIRITEEADEGSLVLIDELGGGTDPEEGQALARAVTEYLLKQGCKGIITTHYTGLKEFAYSVKGIENASMEFDAQTLRPLYNIKIGMPGASNALLISRRLGLKEEILNSAMAALSDGTKSFENILRTAEETRIEADRAKEEAENIKREWAEKVELLDAEREKLRKERENFNVKAKTEARRIVNERTAQADELLAEIEGIFAKEEITQSDLIKARTLKNRLKDKAYEQEEEAAPRHEYEPLDISKLKIGMRVYLPAMESEGIVRSIRAEKKEAEVEVNGIRTRMKFAVIQQPIPMPESKGVKRVKTAKSAGKDEGVKVVKNLSAPISPLAELNVIGLTVQEALVEIDPFLDSALVSGLEEVKIVHGFGSGRLRKGIQEYLRTHRNVESFRLGKYGEGEGGVTIVKLK
jgi:DNA mismatch repair protein MutS2